MADPHLEKKRSFSGLLLILLAFFALFFVLEILNSDSFPPAWFERSAQRQKVIERVQSAGGWESLQHDCEALVKEHRDGVFFYWNHWSTNTLPPALAALQPREIRYDLPVLLREPKDEPQMSVVQIRVFGLHATGGHSTPHFGLEVVCGSGAEGYTPRPSLGGVSGNHYNSYRRVTDRIYEIY